MKRNIFKGLIFLLAISTVMTACRKDEFLNSDNELGDGGKTIVKFFDGPSKTLLFDAFTDTKSITMFSLRKDAVSNSELNTTTTVTLTPAAVPSGYTFLPESVFTLGNSKITKSGSNYVVTFSPGDFVVDFKINVNGAALDPTKKYAMAFTATVSGGTLTAGNQKSISTVMTIKSQYDGMYAFQTGSSVTRLPVVAGDALAGPIAAGSLADRALVTVDGNTLTLTPVWVSGGGVSGIDNLQIRIDPATNLVTMVSLGNATLRNIAGADNKYDPATKTFTLNFEWATVAPSPYNRAMTYILKYSGKRP